MPEPLERLRMALADRYAIHRELGRGGMAAVYLATDLRNQRPVALKVLADELPSVISVARFLREIEIAGGLDHPHILPLLDSGKADELVYFTMPFVDGESLRSRLRRDKQLPIEDAIRIASEVADALSYAHARGIVHRDIKPDNILLANGHARVADFGIARAMTRGTDPKNITATGLIFGTPPYMSPEQLAGERDIDARSDIYSLGCVLYEMLSGEPPYTGASAQAILAKRLREPLPRVTVLRDTVPLHVERALDSALARTPADRFGSAMAFATVLAKPPASSGLLIGRWRVPGVMKLAAGAAVVLAGALLWREVVTATANDSEANVIAVMPFRISAQDSSAFYLREGIVDYLSAQLTGDGVPRAVDSRTILEAWRQATDGGRRDFSSREALALARRLGANSVLLGELLATSDATRITGRILDLSGSVVATRTESGSDDPLLLIDRLTGRLLAASVGEEPWRLTKLSDSLSAVKEYLAGVRAHRRAEYKTSRMHFERALDIDSTFALAALRMIRGGATREGMLRATAIAWRLRGRLSERDRSIVEAHFGIGPNYPGMSSKSERLRAHERAATLNSDAVDVLERFGTDLLTYGQQAGIANSWERATELLDSALALDSTYGPAAQWRLLAAVASRDTTAIRKFLIIEERLGPETNLLFFRLAALLALHDSSGFARSVRRDAAVIGQTWADVAASGALDQIPIDAVEKHVRILLNAGRGTTEDRQWYQRTLFHMAAVQGRLRDVMSRGEAEVNRDLVMTLALAEPVYDGVVVPVMRRMQHTGDSLLDGNGICYRELWEVRHGDSADTRQVIGRLRLLVRDYPPAPIPRVGRWGICALLLEWMLGGTDGPAALARLSALLREGIGLELPGELATLVVARALAAAGDTSGALEILQRRPYLHQLQFTILLPAHLREEGRLAAALGDTATAIRAYQHYLAIRIRPDPGPLTDEARQVRDHLNALQFVANGRDVSRVRRLRNDTARLAERDSPR